MPRPSFSKRLSMPGIFAGKSKNAGNASVPSTPSVPGTPSESTEGFVFHTNKTGLESPRPQSLELSGEDHKIILKIAVLKGQNLLGRDKHGLSDPYAVVKVAGSRKSTAVRKKTLSPEWSDVFEFPLSVPEFDAFRSPTKSQRGRLPLAGIEILLWDHDKLPGKKDYMGEIAIPVDNWFSSGKLSVEQFGDGSDGEDFDAEDTPEGSGSPEHALSWTDPTNRPRWHQVTSSRRQGAKGFLLVKVGFDYTNSSHATIDPNTTDHYIGVDADNYFRNVYSLLQLHIAASTNAVRTRHGRSGRRLSRHATGPELLSVPANMSVGTTAIDDPENDEIDVRKKSKRFGRFRPFKAGGTKPIAPERQERIKRRLRSKSNRSKSAEQKPSLPDMQSNGVLQRSDSRLSDLSAGGSTDDNTSTEDSLSLDSRSAASDGSDESLDLFVDAQDEDPINGSSLLHLTVDELSEHDSADRPVQLDQSPIKAATSKTKKPKKISRPKLKRRQNSYDFRAKRDDLLGTVFFEILEAHDLPRERNVIRTGFDMDPFVIISFGKQTFRTRVIRHNLNPQWNEKLIFHVHRHESKFWIKLAVYDWDKITSNDFVADTFYPVEELMQYAPQPDPETGLFAMDGDHLAGHEMRSFTLDLKMAKQTIYEDKFKPQITIRAKYTPYAALRQQFWHAFLRNFDTNGTGFFSLLELETILDNLGSTLSKETVSTFFTRWNKSLDNELSLQEVVASIEDELQKNESERRYADNDFALLNGSESLDQTRSSSPLEMRGNGDREKVSSVSTPSKTAGEEYPDLSKRPESGAGIYGLRSHPSYSSRHDSEESSTTGRGSCITEDTASATLGGQEVERVIAIKECPICHRRRLRRKADVDIVTHIALCASQDWRRVDRMLIGNYVTTNQAHRKWYTKMVTKISHGKYRFGAESANIIVQDRQNGQMMEEKMQTYVRLGMRLMYRGANTSRMEGAKIRRMFTSMSIKQGMKYDNPSSKREIKPFVTFHNLDINEILEPLDNFKTFNEFFYRKLKPGSRPCDSPDNPEIAVSMADCRFTCFESINEATRIWIKGREFSIDRLFGKGVYAPLAKEYIDGSICIFRLAPQDYHRFHCPVDGTIGRAETIQGEYYTVNPMGVRSMVDVYGSNVRTVVPIESPVFGTVMTVNVGAMMVGSIHITAPIGMQAKRTDELGYYAFGGSTCLALFKPGKIRFDDDLLENGRNAIETLVRVGMRIGKGMA